MLDQSSSWTTFKTQDSSDSRQSHVSELKTKLDGLVETEEWKLEDRDDLMQESNNNAEVVDAVLYVLYNAQILSSSQTAEHHLTPFGGAHDGVSWQSTA